jgi:hypothetical protein
MKIKGVKFGLTSREDVSEKFYGEFAKRWQEILSEVCFGQGVLAHAEYGFTEEGIKQKASLKLKMIDEWERKGRNMAFLKEEDTFMNLLNQKYFGKELK